MLKKSISRLVDYLILWVYTRDLYSWNGIKDTIYFNAIHLSNFKQEQIVSVMPSIDWFKVHDRNELGTVKAYLNNGNIIEIN
ncbi:hypothetical protein CJF42_15240 [Pseudoalteromonas sp. NBT06-2]|uniref:hypothetical protein n=1 Tax=Pseudoalteromonas sp. NBT06-2 TaxID=2025950 RepID=UPI000BA58679|nr:hypothetical protein [Pseudoalteromonas sp. NBT06-2]PAJ73548.1 hypothetical protein CJF42_15240 [Pseudoalteromonas sp. NBT06-2]